MTGSPAKPRRQPLPPFGLTWPAPSLGRMSSSGSIAQARAQLASDAVDPRAEPLASGVLAAGNTGFPAASQPPRPRRAIVAACGGAPRPPPLAPTPFLRQGGRA